MNVLRRPPLFRAARPPLPPATTWEWTCAGPFRAGVPFFDCRIRLPCRTPPACAPARRAPCGRLSPPPRTARPASRGYACDLEDGCNPFLGKIMGLFALPQFGPDRLHLEPERLVPYVAYRLSGSAHFAASPSCPSAAVRDLGSRINKRRLAGQQPWMTVAQAPIEPGRTTEGKGEEERGNLRFGAAVLCQCTRERAHGSQGQLAVARSIQGASSAARSLPVLEHVALLEPLKNVGNQAGKRRLGSP